MIHIVFLIAFCILVWILHLHVIITGLEYICKSARGGGDGEWIIIT
jgi:hypothetical protein